MSRKAKSNAGAEAEAAAEVPKDRHELQVHLHADREKSPAHAAAHDAAVKKLKINASNRLGTSMHAHVHRPPNHAVVYPPNATP